jgi:hypothetical protein
MAQPFGGQWPTPTPAAGRMSKHARQGRVAFDVRSGQCSRPPLPRFLYVAKPFQRILPQPRGCGSAGAAAPASPWRRGWPRPSRRRCCWSAGATGPAAARCAGAQSYERTRSEAWSGLHARSAVRAALRDPEQNSDNRVLLMHELVSKAQAGPSLGPSSPAHGVTIGLRSDHFQAPGRRRAGRCAHRMRSCASALRHHRASPPASAAPAPSGPPAAARASSHPRSCSLRLGFRN